LSDSLSEESGHGDPYELIAANEVSGDPSVSVFYLPDVLYMMLYLHSTLLPRWPEAVSLPSAPRDYSVAKRQKNVLVSGTVILHRIGM
jgi:hypothetical protein